MPTLPPRPDDGHKGTFGSVAVMGGSRDPAGVMIGAPALSARAALRSGCGLARLIVPESIVDAAIVACPSATAWAIPCDPSGAAMVQPAVELADRAAAWADAVVIGPGMGTGPATRAATIRLLQQERSAVIVDADALTAIADLPQLGRDLRAAAILTPHPGEFRRLAAPLNIAHDPTDPTARPQAAALLAQRLGCIVVLKGAGTVVSDGLRTWTNTSGGAELATAGTGDVLAGLIAGLIAQLRRPADPDAATDLVALAAAKLGRPAPASRARPAPAFFDVVRLAVHAHGRAGTRWRETRHASAGLLAHELADLLPEVLEPFRARG